MSYFVYIIECSGSYLYTGITGNLRRRVKEHNEGVGSPVTKNRGPVRLVYWERFETKEDAARREKEIKGWRREKKKRLIECLH